MPRFGIGFAHDHMQANTEAYGAALLGGLGTHLLDFLGNRGRWFTPGQVQLDLLGCQVLGSLRGATEVQRRPRLLNGWVKQFGAFDLDMLAVVVDGFAFQHAPPDTGELHRGLVALFVAEEQAIAGELFRVAAGDQVEQCTATREPVQGRRLTCRHRGRDDARAQGNQEFQALGHRNQRRGNQPGVLARATGRNQHTAKAQAVGSLSDLLQIAVIDRTGTFGGAQVVAVAVGGKKPENIEAHRSCLLRGTQAGATPRHGQIVKAR
ncbi:hypothetical protein D3C77_362080 [compost metagenome]